MAPTKKNPGAGGAEVSGNSNTFAKNPDSSQPRRYAQLIVAESDIAARIIAARYGLPFYRAVLVCQLAGLGGGRP